MKQIFLFITLFSFIANAQTIGKTAEFNAVTGTDYFTNFVINPSAKKNAGNTVTSNATVARDVTAGNLIDGVASFSVDASSINGYVEFTLNTVNDPATSNNCEFKGVYKGDGTLYTAQIVDGSGNLQAQTLVLTNSTTWAPFSVNAPCAASGSRKVRITQTVAGTAPAFNVGKLYYGVATNIGQGTPNNTFSVKVSSAGVVSDENEDFINGNCVVTSTSTYTCTFLTGKFTVAPNCVVDGAGGPSLTSNITSTSSTTFVYTTNASSTGSATATAANFICTKTGVDYVQPSITPNQMAQSWSGYHDSTCSWARTNAAYGDPTADATCTLTERQNLNFGAVTSALSGSDKLPGIVFTPNKAGKYMVCAISSVAPNVTAVAASLGVQLLDSTNTIVVGESVQAGLVTNGYQSYPICSILNVPSVVSTTIKLQTKASAGQLTIGGNAGSAVEWSIFPLTNNIPSPILTGSVTGNQPGPDRDDYIIQSTACTVTPCTPNKNPGLLIATTYVRNSAGAYTLTFNPAFSDVPDCSCNTITNTNRWCNFGSISATTVVVGTGVLAGTSADEAFRLRCRGPR